jgi:hypothetical protein
MGDLEAQTHATTWGIPSCDTIAQATIPPKPRSLFQKTLTTLAPLVKTKVNGLIEQTARS